MSRLAKPTLKSPGSAAAKLASNSQPPTNNRIRFIDRFSRQKNERRIAARGTRK
jgi:hypothetical protein